MPIPDFLRDHQILTGKQHCETIYGMTSLGTEKADPARLLELARGHWSIENRLHWVRDVTFDEDRCRIRKACGVQSIASICNIAISVLRMAGARYILTCFSRLLKNWEKCFAPHRHPDLTLTGPWFFGGMGFSKAKNYGIISLKNYGRKKMPS